MQAVRLPVQWCRKAGAVWARQAEQTTWLYKIRYRVTEMAVGGRVGSSTVLYVASRAGQVMIRSDVTKDEGENRCEQTDQTQCEINLNDKMFPCSNEKED